MAGTTHAAAEASVLAANAQFYRAFSDGDYQAMSALWAQRTPVTCLHPAAHVVVGRASVLESWRQILGGGARFELRCDHARVQVVGDAAIVTCYEASNDDPAHLAATNLFVFEEDRWRMVHHHAGPISTPVPRPGPSRTVN